jgi:hypothetical protein
MGSLSLSSGGEATEVSADGAEGSLFLHGAALTSVTSGAASLVLVNDDPLQGETYLQAGEAGAVKIGCGPPELGPQIKMQGPEELQITVGPPGVGASITMTPESITFKVAEVSFSLTPEGITEVVAAASREVTPQGHNMTAAETEFNIGVQGVAWEGPTESQEVEGGAVENETLGSHTTDAMKNEDAGIAMEV